MSIRAVRALGSTPGADSHVFMQGTSMASPHMAGVAARMIAKKPTVTVAELETKLKSTARAFPGTCGGCGAGIVDANAAVNWTCRDFLEGLPELSGIAACVPPACASV